MGRYSASDESSFVPGVVTPSASMPITGVFGQGKVTLITATSNFVIPAETIRVRLFGAAGTGDGTTPHSGGGGFALKVISGLTVGASVLATIGLAPTTAGVGGTTSFGAYVSATGGPKGPGTPGTGVGGDINTRGAVPNADKKIAGGGVGTVFGDGGTGSGNGGDQGSTGSSGVTGKGGEHTLYQTNTSGSVGGNGEPGDNFSIDFIGTGGGGASAVAGVCGNGANGGGGAGSNSATGGRGGWPGGGSGNLAIGADGFMVVEH